MIGLQAVQPRSLPSLDSGGQSQSREGQLGAPQGCAEPELPGPELPGLRTPEKKNRKSG